MTGLKDAGPSVLGCGTPELLLNENNGPTSPVPHIQQGPVPDPSEEGLENFPSICKISAPI